jgi:hypothetical protein
MQTPVPHFAVNRFGLERIDAVDQTVLGAQLPHNVLRPSLAAWLPCQLEAFSFDPAEER